MPKEGDTTLKFINWKNTLKRGFVAYADFECLMQEKRKFKHNSNTVELTNEPLFSFTKNVLKHIPCGFSIVVVDHQGEIFFRETYRGEDVEKFMAIVLDISKQIAHIYTFYFPMELSFEEEVDFVNSTHCHVCEEPFGPNKIKVRDHCHLTGKYSGAFCNSHNLARAHDYKLPVILHNFKSYDSHIIVHAFDKYGKISLLYQIIQRNI